jgi:hypothetical protein
MIAVPANLDSRPVGVLLGGSGRARIPALPARIVPALLKPSPAPIAWACVACETRAAGC